MDCYKVLGTNKEIIYHMSLKEGESRVDEFIREKYEYTKKRLEKRKKNTILPAELEKLEQQIKEVVEAYEQVKSSIDRVCYHQEVNKVAQNRLDDGRPIAKETAYSVLHLSKESMKMRTDEENDTRIETQKNNLLKGYSYELEKTTNFSKKEKIRLQMKKIEESYQLINTADKRREYDRKIQEEARERKIEEKYSHILECSENLIANGTTPNGECLDNKMVMIIKNDSPQESTYFNSSGQKIKIKRTAVIAFRDWMGLNCNDLNEYEVKRSINGKEKTNIVYSNLSILYLSINRRTGEAINPGYYNCVVNQLLSDDVIDGAKYNGGYIGEVAQDVEGNYYLTIGKKKLSPMELEKLAAVMIIKRREKELKKKEKEKDKWQK